MRWIKYSLPLLLSVACAFAADVAKITPAEAARRVASDQAILIDVREPKEWAESGVAQPALLLPKSDFDAARADWKPILEKAGKKEIVVYCRSGRRSAQVAEQLQKEGFNVANAGGFEDWKKAGLPVRKVEAPTSAP